MKFKSSVDKLNVEKLFSPKYKINPVFYWHKSNIKFKNSRLNNIYSIECETAEGQLKLLTQLRALPDVVYVEKKPKVELFETPDDPSVSLQYHLDKINIFSAWDITTGDSTVVVGIVDTGTDFTHDDLTGKVAINRNDPINGIDDDLDGFVDNYYGWDMSENNNNPQADMNGHGVIVTGIAAAATNNALGIAGVGFNIRYLPVKTMNNEGQLNTGWEGIVYAADHGVDVIVCSWGGVVPTMFGKDVIDYATYDKNVLVVAAAGNSSDVDIYYPAAYPEVLSVAATNIYDQKWIKSTYGYAVDICAPGQSIFSTKLGNGFISGNGTSFAAPSAAAVAALIKHQRPWLSPLQIKQQIVNTTYLLDTIPQNVIYAGQLGSGRLDAYAALTDTMISGPQLINMEVNGMAIASNTISITGEIINYLKSSTLQVEVSSLSSYATVLEPNLEVGILQTNEVFVIDKSILEVKLHSDIPYDENVILRFAINDGKKMRYRYFSFIANQSWVEITKNNLNLTVPANGRLGFNTLSPLQGHGFWLDGGQNIVWDAGIIYGNSTSQTHSVFYGGKPFQIVKGNDSVVHPDWGQMYEAQMIDTNQNEAMNISTIQQMMVSRDDLLQDAVFMKWRFINNSEQVYDNFHMGVFIDWNLNNVQKNNVYFDDDNQLAICKSFDNSMFVGVKIFDRSFHNYAFELDNETEGINIIDGFTQEERWFAMSNERQSAGGVDGCDVAHMVSTNGIILELGDTVDFDVVMAVSFHESRLVKIIKEAESFHSNLTSLQKSVAQNSKIYPNPTSGELHVETLSKIKTIYIRDLSGVIQFVFSPYSNSISITPKLRCGLYIIQIETVDGESEFSKVFIE